MTPEQSRDTLTKSLLTQTSELLAEGAVTYDTLNRIQKAVTGLSERVDLWGEIDFPPPASTEQQNRYLVAQDDQQNLSLYLNVMRPGKKIPPHNHTTWACIAAVEGIEINTLYERVDDRTIDGQAKLEVKEVVELKPGNALTMLPEDIHSVEIRGTDVIRHLHFYGRALERLSGRTMYDMTKGTCRNMDIGVTTK